MIPSLAALAAPLASGLLAGTLCGPQAGEPGGHASPTDLGEHFELADGVLVELWADSPQLFNPTAIDIDADGRVWVAEAVNYRHFRNAPDQRRWHEEGDRIVVLEDLDGDGACDRSVVFAQDPDLVAPLGVLVHGDGALVSCSPSIVHYRDTDGDGRADRKDVWLEGFGGRDHDHGVHSVVPGPDGAWYLNAGNAGPHRVRGQGGWNLRSGSFYSGGVGERSDDGRAWVGGLVLRARPDGSGLEVLADNFRNCYEVAVDSFGDLFLADNDDDGNRGCRTVWVHEGGDYGYTSSEGSRSWRSDQRPGQPTARAHWHQDDPGVMPPGCINGAGGPTGVAVYEGRHLPAALHGTVLNCDAGARVVYAHSPRIQGSGLDLEPGVLIRARDGAEESRWFRPSDVCVAPDGSVLVADWWDPGVGGHAAGDREARGRILRLRAEGRPTAAAPRGGPVAELASPNLQRRHAAAETLRARGESALDELGPLLEGSDPVLRARALWIAAGAGAPGRARVHEALEDPSSRVRVTALRALRHAGTDLPGLLREVVQSEDPALRREACISLRDLPYESAPALWLSLAERLPADDRWAVEALGIAAEGKEEALFGDLVALHGTAPIEWTDSFADLAWRLHPASAASSFAARAMALDLPLQRRLQAVDAIAFMDGEAAAETMVALHRSTQDEVRARAGWWLQRNAEDRWADLEALTAVDLDARRPATPTWTSEVLRGGLVEARIDLDGVRRLWLVVDDGGDGNSCDWADWGEPVLHGPEGTRRLTTMPWSHASAGWGSVKVDQNCNGGPLRVGDRSLAFGFGTHSPSEIAFELPAGEWDRLEMQVGPDHGGTSQGGQPTTVRFEVYVEREAPPVDLRPQLGELLAEDTPRARRRSLARELAADPQGGLLLLQLAEAEQIPTEVWELVGEEIHRNPDLGVRAMAGQFFPRGATDAPPLPPIAELAARPGDAARGRTLFLDTELACSRCHRIGDEGGALGPNLDPIHEKLDRTGLLDAILNPSAAILMGYESWMIETGDGLRLVGFLLADGAKVVLRDTDGNKHVLRREDVAFRKKLRLSAMPDDVATRLDPQQLADLVEYLSLSAEARRALR